MWLWFFLGFNFICKLHCWSNGNFQEACDSMRPQHGVHHTPASEPPPFIVSYQLGSNAGDPITVSLESKKDIKFLGFMLEARSLSSDGDGPPLGKFITLDSSSTRLLKCGTLEDSAVSNRLNTQKSLIQVNWTRDGEEEDIMFRATFLQTYSIYWERVNITVLRPTSTPKPEPTTVITATPATQTATPGTTATATTTTQMSTATPGTTATATTKPQLSTATPGTAARTTQNVTKCDLQVCLNPITVEIKMGLSNIIMALHLTTCRRHYLLKITRIVGSLCSFLLPCLILICIWASFKVVFIGLVSALLVTGFIELVIVLMPFGPSHELNGLCDFGLLVCFALYHIVTNVYLHVRIHHLIKEFTETGRKCWSWYALIVQTVLILLTIFWNCVLYLKRRNLLHKVKAKDKNWDDQGIKRCLLTCTVSFISAVFMAGITSMSLWIIVELYWMQNN